MRPPFEDWPDNPVSQRYMLIEWLDMRMTIAIVVTVVFLVIVGVLKHKLLPVPLAMDGESRAEMEIATYGRWRFFFAFCSCLEGAAMLATVGYLFWRHLLAYNGIY